VAARPAIELYRDLAAKPAAKLTDDDRRRLEALRAELVYPGMDRKRDDQNRR
jgi:hypothetical protein